MSEQPMVNMHYSVFRRLAYKADWSHATVQVHEVYDEECDAVEYVEYRAMPVSKIVPEGRICVIGVPTEEQGKVGDERIFVTEKVLCVMNPGGIFSFIAKKTWDTCAGSTRH